MRCTRPLFLAAALAICASAAGVTGTWEGSFLCPPEQRPKTVGSMTFELEANGTVLSGAAHVGSWPGNAPISEGKMDGDRISFTVVGSGAWRSSSSQGEASGYPRLRFTGTVEGDRMALTLVWDSVMIYGKEAAAQQWQVSGKRASK